MLYEAMGHLQGMLADQICFCRGRYWPRRLYGFHNSSVGRGQGGIKSSGPVLRLPVQERGLDLCIFRGGEMLPGKGHTLEWVLCCHGAKSPFLNLQEGSGTTNSHGDTRDVRTLFLNHMLISPCSPRPEVHMFERPG